MITSPRILDRALGTVAGDHDAWRALEAALEAFTRALRAAPVDEGDEAAATRSYVRLLAEAGLLRWVVPAAFGGAAPTLLSTPICLIRQWLARESGALDTAFVMQGLGSNPVTMAGGEALRRALLPRVAAGAAICAFALTEPEAGSDIKNMRSLATACDGGARLRGLLEVRVLHADRLRLGLGLDRVGEVHVELALQHRLGHAGREVGPGRDAGRQLEGRAVDRRRLLVGHHPVRQADLQAALGRHPLAEEKDLRGVAEADHAGQQPARAHVRPRQPDLREQEREERARAHHPQVARQGHHRARARGHPLDAGHDRQLAAAHRLDQLARHPREAQQPVHVAREQVRDDVLDVAAAAERLALALQHQRARPLGVVAAALDHREQVGQLAIHRERQRVEAVRSVEGLSLIHI